MFFPLCLLSFITRNPSYYKCSSYTLIIGDTNGKIGQKCGSRTRCKQDKRGLGVVNRPRVSQRRLIASPRRVWCFLAHLFPTTFVASEASRVIGEVKRRVGVNNISEALVSAVAQFQMPLRFSERRTADVTSIRWGLVCPTVLKMLLIILSAYSVPIALCDNVPDDIACSEPPLLCNRMRQIERVTEAQKQLIVQLQVQLNHQSHQLHQQQTALDDIAAARLADKAQIQSFKTNIATLLADIANTHHHDLYPILRPFYDAAGSLDVNARSDDGGPLEALVNRMGQQLTTISAEIQAMKTAYQLLQKANQQQDQNLQDARTSTFVHWGSSLCPSDSQFVYSGIVGGSLWTHSGAATNTLCLTISPVPGPRLSLLHWTYVFGAEYETWDSTHHDKDPVCAVCRANHATTIMIPGTNVCTQGWTKQYDGYLMAGKYDHVAGTEYVCVDKNLHSHSGSDDNHNGLLLYYTVTQCGSLPCGPYVNNTIVLCAVCSQ